jgi:hypothetical protein
MNLSIELFYIIFCILEILLLAYGIILYSYRERIHKLITEYTIQKKEELIKTWHKLLKTLKLALLILPFCFIAIIILLYYFMNVPILISTIPLLLLYINIIIIYIESKWHLEKLLLSINNLSIQ